jgi:hypothetical protein
MAKIPVLDAVRIIPRDTDFLDRKSGARGEIFFDRTANSLRLYDGISAGGINLAKSDLSNVSNAEFLAKATAAGVEGGGGGSGNVTVSVSPIVPGSPTNGNLWLNTETGILYVYINDGNSNQWIQPAVPTSGGSADLTGYATETYVDTAINNIPAVDLTGLATETYVDTAINNIPAVDLTGLATETYVDSAISELLESSAETIQTLNELTAALEDDDFASAITNELGLKAPINNPTFTGTVSGITATMVGLGNVNNTADNTKTVLAATNVDLNSVSTNATFYLPFFSGNTNGNKALNFDTDLTFNPSTNTLIIGSGAGTISANLSGNASTATVASGLVSISSYQIGSLGVGTAASGTTGEIRATNNVTAFYSSDIKFKEEIRDIPNALLTVNSIGGKLFSWTDTYLQEHGGQDDYFLRKEDFGVIAQDVLKVFPQAVRSRSDGSLAVDYEKLSALAFAAIAELTKRVEQLENR